MNDTYTLSIDYIYCILISRRVNVYQVIILVYIDSEKYSQVDK